MNEGFIKYLGNSKEIVKADIMDIMTSQASQEILIERSQDLLEDVFNLSNECVYLAINDNNSLLYLNQVDNSTRVIKMRNSIASYAPLHCTALGKIILAYCEIDISALELNEYTKNTLQKTRYLKKELEKVLENKYAIENEEYEYGLSSLAVAIFDYENTFLGAVGIAGLSARLSEESLQVLALKMLKLSSKKIRI